MLKLWGSSCAVCGLDQSKTRRIKPIYSHNGALGEFSQLRTKTWWYMQWRNPQPWSVSPNTGSPLQEIQPKTKTQNPKTTQPNFRTLFANWFSKQDFPSHPSPTQIRWECSQTVAVLPPHQKKESPGSWAGFMMRAMVEKMKKKQRNYTASATYNWHGDSRSWGIRSAFLLQEIRSLFLLHWQIRGLEFWRERGAWSRDDWICKSGFWLSIRRSLGFEKCLFQEGESGCKEDT